MKNYYSSTHHKPVSLNTLAQTGSNFPHSEAILIQGNGSDLSNKKALINKVKRKLISDKMALGLIDVNEPGSVIDKQSLWNTFHCQDKICSSDGRSYSKYCKNRFSTICNANRKADIINRYLPTIKTWDCPFMVTLTVKAVPKYQLHSVMNSMLSKFRKIVEQYRKKNLRGKGLKLQGVRSLECNFNPVRHTYNPHFHCIVANEQMADILVHEWLRRSKAGWTYLGAQKKDKVFNNVVALIEVVKYGSKIFTEPDLNKKIKNREKVYIRALNNIFGAMNGFRIFDRFGFNLPKQQQPKIGARVVTNFTDWKYSLQFFDWFDMQGNQLSHYLPPEKLIKLLFESMDMESE